MSKKTVFNLQQEVASKDLVVVLSAKWDPRYQAACEISNARFDFRPSGIAYCKNAEHVAYCINFCRDNDIAFRVRSGGHQHEGMCSGDNVLIIDLSEIYEIEYLTDDTAWIPVGKQLQNVYKELEQINKIIPGGGCQSVNVGGLTHGGGWGLSTRYLGMTCDNILAAEIILANGAIVEATKDNKYADLFWGIRGGGGGNFGIVTRFKFRLTSLPNTVSNFAFIFDGNVREVTKAWVKMHLDPKVPNALSTGCSILLHEPAQAASTTPFLSVRVGGQFYGAKQELLDILNPYFKQYPVLESVSWINETHFFGNAKQMTLGAQTLSSKQGFVAEFLNPTAPMNLTKIDGFKADKAIVSIDDLKPQTISTNVSIAPPPMTCDTAHAHKVSSCFPKNYMKSEGVYDYEKYYSLVDKMVDYMEGQDSRYTSDSKLYMSLHCLGGVLQEIEAKDRGAFPYYDKPFLLQMQSWWDLSGNEGVDKKREAVYVKWIEEFRKSLLTDVEGAFINFVDYDLVEDATTAEGKLELLKIYYQQNLDQLRLVKSTYDKENLFNFRMSITPTNM